MSHDAKHDEYADEYDPLEDAIAESDEVMGEQTDDQLRQSSARRVSARSTYGVQRAPSRLRFFLASGWAASAVVIPLMLLAIAFGLPALIISRNTIMDQVSATENPSFRSRYESLGQVLILKYYSEERPVTDVSGSIKWPGDVEGTIRDSTGNPASGNDSGSGSQQSDDQSGWNGYGNENGDSGDQSQDASGDSGNSSSPAGVATKATISGIYLAHASQSGSLTVSAKGQQPTTGRNETLTYFAYFNGTPVNITITLFIPDYEEGIKSPVGSKITFPVLVAPPTLERAEAINIGRSSTTKPTGEGWESAGKVTPETRQVIERWIKAYTTNNVQDLQAIVADPEARSYAGMPGKWTTTDDSPKLSWMLKRSKDGMLVAEVAFSMQDETANKSVTVQVMDLLIDASNAKVPEVQAWGPSGSSASLTPFQNALTPADAKRAQSSDDGSTDGSGSTDASTTETPSTTESTAPSSSSAPSSSAPATSTGNGISIP